MTIRAFATLWTVVAASAISAGSTLSGQSPDSSRSAYRAEHLVMHQRYREFPSTVGRAAMRQAGGHVVDPHWLSDGNRFWYADSRFEGRTPIHTTIYLVDPAANTVTELFDVERLRRAIEEVPGEVPETEGIPFRDFEFIDSEETVVRFELDERTYELDLKSYSLRPGESAGERSAEGAGYCDDGDRSSRSPDDRWIACVRDHDVWVIERDSGAESRITQDGSEAYGWTIASPDGPSGSAWSPDGGFLALRREDRRGMPKIPVVRWLDEPPEVSWIVDEPPARPRVELHLYDMSGHRLRMIAPGGEVPWWIGTIGWRSDGSELLYQRATAAGLREDILALDPSTGESRLLHSEAAETPVYTDRAWYSVSDGSEAMLAGGDRLLFVSERSGSLQLYLKDVDGGRSRQLTSGPGPVVRIVGVDEARGWVYYSACGDPERPYDVHLYRVGLDGTGPARLTEASASHEAAGMGAYFMRPTLIRLSPSRDYFIARHARPDRLPITELRRADGTLVRVLAEARLGPIAEAYRWRPPEEFVVDAADGETELWGLMWKPYDFDPSRRYPIVEVFYSGAVPRTFDPGPYATYAEQLAQLGFVTLMLEGSGSDGRGRPFRDAYAGRPGAFIEDHATAIEQLVAEHAYLDGSRVGAYGYSWGAAEALWAVIEAPGVYRVGVAVAPTEPQSTAERAALLAGAGGLEAGLLLVHGTADRAAPLRGSMRFLAAAIAGGRRVEQLLLPDRGHGLGADWEYAHDRARDFFLEHLDP